MTTRNVRPLRTVLGVGGFTAIGIILRVVSLNTRGLWLDEAITVSQASHPTLEVIRTLATGVHPPLYHVLIHYWILAFGSTEIAVRSFSVVVGVLAIPAAYWAGARLYDHRTGMIACGLVALSPFQIWYSQEARMYSLLFLAGLMSTAFLVLAVRENRVWHWLGYLAWTIAGVMTHYFFLFALAGQIIFYIFVELVPSELGRRRAGTARTRWYRPWMLFSDVSTFGPWLASMTFIFVVLGVWLVNSVFAPQPGGSSALVGSVTGGSGLGYGQEAPFLALRFNDVAAVVVQMTVGFHSFPAMAVFVAMWPLLIYLAFVLMHLVRPASRGTWALLLTGVGGMMAMFLIGQWQGQILASRYFMGVAGALTLLAARMLAELRVRIRTVVLSALAVLALIAWFDQSYNLYNSMRYDNREAFATIVRQWKPGDVVVYVPFYLDPLTNYYLPSAFPTYGFPQYGAFGQLRSSGAQIDQDLSRVVGPSGRVWLFLSFQNVPTLRRDAYAVRYWFKHNGFRAALDQHRNQVELLRFDGANTGFFLHAPGFEPSATPLPRGPAAPASAPPTSAPAPGATGKP